MQALAEAVPELVEGMAALQNVTVFMGVSPDVQRLVKVSLAMCVHLSQAALFRASSNIPALMNASPSMPFRHERVTSSAQAQRQRIRECWSKPRLSLVGAGVGAGVASGAGPYHRSVPGGGAAPRNLNCRQCSRGARQKTIPSPTDRAASKMVHFFWIGNAIASQVLVSVFKAVRARAGRPADIVTGGLKLCHLGCPCGCR